MDSFLDALHAFLTADASVDTDAARLVQFATHCTQICSTGLFDAHSLHDFVACTRDDKQTCFKSIRGTLHVTIAYMQNLLVIDVFLKNETWCGCPAYVPFKHLPLVSFEIDTSTCEIRKHDRSLAAAPTLSRALLDACIQHDVRPTIDYRLFANPAATEHWPSDTTIRLRYDRNNACFLLNDRALRTRYAPIGDVFCAFFEKRNPNASDLLEIVQALIDNNPQLMPSVDVFLDKWRAGERGDLPVSLFNHMQVSYSRADSETTLVPLLFEIANERATDNEPYELLFRARASADLRVVYVMDRAGAAALKGVAAAFLDEQRSPCAT